MHDLNEKNKWLISEYESWARSKDFSGLSAEELAHTLPARFANDVGVNPDTMEDWLKNRRVPDCTDMFFLAAGLGPSALSKANFSENLWAVAHALEKYPRSQWPTVSLQLLMIELPSQHAEIVKAAQHWDLQAVFHNPPVWYDEVWVRFGSAFCKLLFWVTTTALVCFLLFTIPPSDLRSFLFSASALFFGWFIGSWLFKVGMIVREMIKKRIALFP